MLCKCHYELAVAGSEALEALKKYINKNQARILRTGACLCVDVRDDERGSHVKCLHALHTSFGACEPGVRVEFQGLTSSLKCQHVLGQMQAWQAWQAAGNEQSNLKLALKIVCIPVTLHRYHLLQAKWTGSATRRAVRSIRATGSVACPSRRPTARPTATQQWCQQSRTCASASRRKRLNRRTAGTSPPGEVQQGSCHLCPK